MNVRVNHLSKSILTFSVISFIRPALGILLLPMYLSYLSPSDYAELALYGIVAMVLGVFANFKLDHGMRTFFFDYEDDPKKQATYLRSVLTASFIASSALIIFVFFMGDTIFDVFFSADKLSFYPLGLMAVISNAIGQATLSYFVYLQNNKWLKEFVTLRLIDIFITVLSQVVFVTIFDLGILGIILGNLVSSLVTLLLVLARNINCMLNWPDMKLLIPSLKFVLPLILFSFVTLFEKTSDRLVLERFLDYSDLGIYTLVLTLVGASALIFNSLDNAFRPYLYSQLKKNDDPQKITDFLTVYCALGLTSLMAIASLATNIYLITSNTRYEAVSEYVPLAAIAFSSVCITRFYALNYVFYKKSGSLTIWTTLKVFVTFALLLLIVPVLGIQGAFIAVGIGNILNVVLFIIHIRSFAKINADAMTLGLLFALFMLLVLVIPFIFGWVFSEFYSLIVAILYCSLTYFMTIKKAREIVEVADLSTSQP